MSIVSSEVEINLHNRNIRYYENLGYEIPRYYDKLNHKESVKRGTKIMVNVKDLSHGSQIKIKVQCDYCGKIFDVVYHDYLLNNHDGKTYCNHCASTALISGKNHYKWNPNKTNEERVIARDYPEYKNFVQKVLARDNYICQCCGDNHGKMEVHHLDGYDNHKDKRIDVSNGITLCSSCHGNFHKHYGKGNNEKWQYIEWLNLTQLELKKYDGVLPTARQIFDYEENKRYNSAYEYAKLHKVCPSLVYGCCNHDIKKRKYIKKNGEISYSNYTISTVCGHHLFYLSDYEKITSEELKVYLQKSKNRLCTAVICLTTQIKFDSIMEASNYYNINNSGITACCSGKAKSAGKLSDGTSLNWMYLSNFEKLTAEEQGILLSKTKEGEIYEDVSKGCRYFCS